jgi:hypothetical protein
MKELAILLAFAPVCLAAPHLPCSLSDVSGSYAFLANGSVFVPPLAGPFSRIGYFTADGNGGVNIHTLALYNGINFGDENFAGTYTVADDCTFNMTANVPAPIFSPGTFVGQVALGGGDIVFMLTSLTSPTAPPALTDVVGYGSKRAPGFCNSETLAGSWRMDITGTSGIIPGTSPGTTYRQVGQFVADGTSALTASFVTSSNNGTIATQTGTGTYSVNTDCTFNLTYTISGTPYGIRGSIFNGATAYIALNMPGPSTTLPLAPGVSLPVIITGAVATGKMVKEVPGFEDLPLLLFIPSQPQPWN